MANLTNTENIRPAGPDESLQEFVETRYNEAQERLAQFRGEVMRWERVASACGAALKSLSQSDPACVPAQEYCDPEPDLRYPTGSRGW